MRNMSFHIDNSQRKKAFPKGRTPKGTKKKTATHTKSLITSFCRKITAEVIGRTDMLPSLHLSCPCSGLSRRRPVAQGPRRWGQGAVQGFKNLRDAQRRAGADPGRCLYAGRLRGKGLGSLTVRKELEAVTPCFYLSLTVREGSHPTVGFALFRPTFFSELLKRGTTGYCITRKKTRPP